MIEKLELGTEVIYKGNVYIITGYSIKYGKYRISRKENRHHGYEIKWILFAEAIKIEK